MSAKLAYRLPNIAANFAARRPIAAANLQRCLDGAVQIF